MLPLTQSEKVQLKEFQKYKIAIFANPEFMLRNGIRDIIMEI